MPSQTIDEMTGRRPFSSSATMRVTSRALARQQREHLAGVAVGHHRDDAGLGGEPGGVLAQRGLVDAVIGGEGAGDRGDDAAVVLDRGHGVSLSDNRHAARLAVGMLDGEMFVDGLRMANAA